jgi:hypothetical protein
LRPADAAATPEGLLEPGRATLVLSDLHLGAARGDDVLRRPGAARERLVAAIGGVDRLVLAGDLLELRHGPAPLILDRARDALGALGAALRPDGEIVVLAGNHDHRLLRPWLHARRLAGTPLPIATLAEPHEVSPLAGAVAEALRAGRDGGGPRVRCAYPGVWVAPPTDGRGGVYVTHGHYQDVVWRMPTVERLVAAVVARAQGVPPGEARTPEEFERLLAPGYGWLDGMAEYARTATASASQRTSSGVWETLNHGRGARARALRVAVPATVRALARAGLGDLEHRIDPDTLRIGGLRGMARMIDALGVRADHVVVGHLHRAGPLAGDAAWEWRTEHGGRLWNSGCWVHNGVPLSGEGPGSPYWPGRAVRIDADGRPELLGLLDALDDPWAGQDERPAHAPAG